MITQDHIKLAAFKITHKILQKGIMSKCWPIITTKMKTLKNDKKRHSFMSSLLVIIIFKNMLIFFFFALYVIIFYVVI